MPRFKSIIFYYNSPKIKLFLQKNAKFWSAGGSSPTPSCLRRLGAPPPDPQDSPPIANFWLRAWILVCLSSSLILTLKQRRSRGHKARGQGQEHKKNPRPRTAFPRTDPLEAKDRNAQGQGQGPRTQAQVFSKKKCLQKFFSGDQYIGEPRIFDWGRPKPQITLNDVIKIFSKEEVFVGQSYRRVEDLKSFPVRT